MKNKLLLGALLISAVGAFTGCSDDNDSNPTLIQPKEFKLNTPAYVTKRLICPLRKLYNCRGHSLNTRPTMHLSTLFMKCNCRSRIPLQCLMQRHLPTKAAQR